MKCNLIKNNFTTKEEYEEGIKIFFKFLKERNAFYVYLNNLKNYLSTFKNVEFNSPLDYFMKRKISFDMFLLSSFDINNSVNQVYVSYTKWAKIDDEWVNYIEDVLKLSFH